MLRTLFKFANLTVGKLLDELLHFTEVKNLIIIDEPSPIIKEMLYTDTYDNASPQTFLFLYGLKYELVSAIDIFIFQLLNIVKADIEYIREFKRMLFTGEIKHQEGCLCVKSLTIRPYKEIF